MDSRTWVATIVPDGESIKIVLLRQKQDNETLIKELSWIRQIIKNGAKIKTIDKTKGRTQRIDIVFSKIK